MTSTSSVLDKEHELLKALKITLDSGAGLMASGSQDLHDLVANRLERSLRKQLPQVEIRFEDLSISARVIVKDAAQANSELPTLANVVKTEVREMYSSKHVVEKEILHSMSGVFRPGTMTSGARPTWVRQFVVDEGAEWTIPSIQRRRSGRQSQALASVRGVCASARQPFANVQLEGNAGICTHVQRDNDGHLRLYATISRSSLGCFDKTVHIILDTVVTATRFSA